MTPSTIIGVDLGGTKIAIGTYHAITGELLSQQRVETNAGEGFPVVFERMVVLLKEQLTPAVQGIGVGVPGLVEHETGVIRTLPNIPGAEGFALRDALKTIFPCSVAVENDARCFTLAEAMAGAGKGHRVVVGVTLGTGVGGGIVIHEKIFHGHSGFAGELGHMLLQPGKPPYATEDARGDVEQFLSGTAMGKRCEAAGRPEDYLAGEVCSFMRPDVFKEIAWLCTNLTYVLDPSIIVFGGSAGRALKPHFPSILAEQKKWLLPNTHPTPLAISELTDSGMRGAALLVRTSI